eukprot:8221972-Heterocapsa_arctica.AAC.1
MRDTRQRALAQRQVRVSAADSRRAAEYRTARGSAARACDCPTAWFSFQSPSSLLRSGGNLRRSAT